MAEHDTTHAAPPAAPTLTEPPPAVPAAPPTPPGRAAPAKQRLLTLDALRGFAVLGILVPNIISFGWPMAAMMDPGVIGPGRWNEIGHAVMSIGFQGKFMFLFAMMFGAGVVLFDRKTTPRGTALCARCGYERKGLPEGAPCPECTATRTHGRPRLTDGAALWHRRCAALLAIGLIHAYFFWYGDILTWYAVAGLTLLWWVRKLPAQTQVWGGLGLYFFGALLLFAVTAVGLFALSSGGATSEQVMGADPAEESAAYLGTWADAATFRFSQTIMMHLFLGPIFLPALWGIMVLGMGLTKLGVLTGERSLRFHATLAAVLVPIGAILTVGVYAAVQQTEHAGFLWQGMAQAVGVPLAIGYSQLVVALARWAPMRAVAGALANVGRMALTNYLFHTLACTTLMYGYGFGRYASVEFPGLFVLVAAIWIANIAGSAIWLRFFDYGPAEWLWRQATYLGLRTETTPATQPG